MPLVHSLWNNSVGPEGARALSEALKTNSSLKALKYAASCSLPYCQHALTLTHVLLLSVGFNDIIGDGAEHLAKVVLEHTTLTDFCNIPLNSLRENSIEELDLNGKGVGVPGAIVLSSLLPSATALKTLKYAATHVSLSPTVSTR